MLTTCLTGDPGHRRSRMQKSPSATGREPPAPALIVPSPSSIDEEPPVAKGTLSVASPRRRNTVRPPSTTSPT